MKSIAFLQTSSTAIKKSDWRSLILKTGYAVCATSYKVKSTLLDSKSNYNKNNLHRLSLITPP
jgi:hypothetical protein